MNKKRSAILAIGAFLLTNLKWLVGLLKFSKFGATFISMLITLLLYGQLYGWKFGLALVYLIFVHEMGHLIAAKRKGIRTSPAIFIPFAGAFIAMKDQPRDARTEAYLAYGGPLAGLLSFLPAVPLYGQTGDPFWALVIYLGAMINLFNLLPVSPLDGGRIVSVLSTKIWFFGLLGIGVMLFLSPDPIMLMIFLFGLITWWNRMREGYQEKRLAYEKQRLRRFLDEAASWPELPSVAETKERLHAEYLATQARPHEKKRFYIPFIQDEQRLQKEMALIDRHYAEAAWMLFQQWERTPVSFLDGDPDRPLPSPLLEEAIGDGYAHLHRIEEQLQRLTTYYQSPASTKWKVLAAYLGLAIVLSLFLLYGSAELEQHRQILGI